MHSKRAIRAHFVHSRSIHVNDGRRFGQAPPFGFLLGDHVHHSFEICQEAVGGEGGILANVTSR